MSKCKKEELLKSYPQLFKEQICPICGKKFYLDYYKIKRKINILKNNKNAKLIIACCVSHTTSLQLKILGSSLSNKELHKIIVETKRNNIDENGLNGLQRAARKAVKTKRADIDENGLDGIQRETKKAMKTARGRIDENGKNSYERAAEKGIETKRNTIDKNGLNIIQKSIINAENTNLKRRGAKCYFQTQEYKDYMSQPEIKIKTYKKIYESKKKNGTSNTSNLEDIIYQALVYKFDFDNIIPQYKNKEKYNFACDFYIKSLDLYIELNFYWTHGYAPYDKNNIKHQEQLTNWTKNSQNINFNKKKKDGYKNAIYIWTITDPLKFQTAKQNNLNYLAFYNLEQFFDWYLSIS